MCLVPAYVRLYTKLCAKTITENTPPVNCPTLAIYSALHKRYNPNEKYATINKIQVIRGPLAYCLLRQFFMICGGSATMNNHTVNPPYCKNKSFIFYLFLRKKMVFLSKIITIIRPFYTRLFLITHSKKKVNDRHLIGQGTSPCKFYTICYNRIVENKP